jgi:polysaccharide export outer membrane protein
MLRASILGAMLVLGACTVVPTSGPAGHDVRIGQADRESLPYAYVPITPKVVDILLTNAPRLSVTFQDRGGPTELRFGIGDTVNISIFESAAGGLFIPLEGAARPGNFIALPPQAVDNKGNISVPYAGFIRAQGRTAAEIQASIVAALKDRALEPQAVVTLAEQRSSLISVVGEAVGSMRLPANPSGERMLDVIARAGLKSPGYDLWVMLQRQGRREIVPFGALIYEPANNNIYVRPNDTIFIYSEAQTFLAFGATGGATGGAAAGIGATTVLAGARQFPFAAWRISLAEAIAKAGGHADGQADPASTFLYRGETRELAQMLGIDCTPYPGPIIPVIYNLNFRDPAGFFLASKFQMRNKDVIYVANAISVDSTKFMSYLTTIIGTAEDPVLAATSVYTLRALIASSGVSTTAVLAGGAIAPVVAP